MKGECDVVYVVENIKTQDEHRFEFSTESCRRMRLEKNLKIQFVIKALI